MKNALTFLRELTARFPLDDDDEQHTISLVRIEGDDMLPVETKVYSLEIGVMTPGIRSGGVYVTLLPSDFDKPIDQLVEGIARTMEEENNWWTNDDEGDECQQLGND